MNSKIILKTAWLAFVAYAIFFFVISPEGRARLKSRYVAIHDALSNGENALVTRGEIPPRRSVRVISESPQSVSAQPSRPSSSPIKYKLAPQGPKKTIHRADKPTLERSPAHEKPMSEIQTEETVPRDTADATSQQKDKNEAYAILLDSNKKMADLVANRIPSLKFKRWSLLRSDGEDFWIDVVFTDKASSEDVHYIWRVNVASKEIRPESHEAKKIYLM